MKIEKRVWQIGLVWSLVLFVWWFPLFTIINWGFNPYRASHWRFLADEFGSGWTIKSSSDWFFIGTLILLLPFWLLGWHLCLKVQWKKLWARVVSKTKALFFRATTTPAAKKAKFKPKGSHKKIRPAPINTSPKTVSTTAEKLASDKTKTVPRAPVPSAPRLNETQARAAGNFSENHRPDFLTAADLETPIEDIQIPAIPRLEENLQKIIQSAGYKLIQGPIVNKKMFDYMAIDGEKIVLVLCDNEKGDWLVDEETFDGEAPLWFSETAHRPSPIFETASIVKSFRDKLQKRNLDFTVTPIFVEKAGNIINADEMAGMWKKLNVTVCRTDLGGPAELPGFKETLPPAGAPANDLDVAAIQELL